MTRNFNLMN